MKVILWAVFLLVVIFGALYSLKSLDVTQSSYSSYDEISSIPNIFEAGWVPRWLPVSATQIKESHDIDTNESWLTFRISPSDDFYKGCKEIKNYDTASLIKAHSEPNRFHEFYDDLVGAIKDSTVNFYSCDSNYYRILAIDHIESHGYIWLRSE